MQEVYRQSHILLSFCGCCFLYNIVCILICVKDTNSILKIVLYLPGFEPGSFGLQSKWSTERGKGEWFPLTESVSSKWFLQSSVPPPCGIPSLRFECSHSSASLMRNINSTKDTWSPDVERNLSQKQINYEKSRCVCEILCPPAATKSKKLILASRSKSRSQGQWPCCHLKGCH